MKLIRTLAIVLAVCVLGYLAWTRLPGVRTKIQKTVDDYGGWTQEARQEDPIGFVEYAEEKLRGDLSAFERSRVDLMDSKRNAEDEKLRNEGLLELANELATQFKGEFKAAESAGSWPVTVRGASYDRDQLVEQVESILSDKQSYTKVIAIYEQVISSASERDLDLKDRIKSTQATLVELKAQKELLRVDKLTAEADELLGQVDELLSGNHAALSGLETPVRSVEDLLAASKGSGEESRPRGSALDYLNAN